MEYPSIDLRRRLVEAYQAKRSGTYEETAKLFGVGEATVSRLLRRFRETGDVQYKPVGGNNPRKIDLAWLREHLEANPDVRLVDRVDAWERQSGKRVSVACMCLSVHAVGWTHKKRRRSPASGTSRTSKRNAKRLRRSSPR